MHTKPMLAYIATAAAIALAVWITMGAPLPSHSDPRIEDRAGRTEPPATARAFDLDQRPG
jgi:hypothetical protein